MTLKKISIISPTYNEENNIISLHEKVKEVIKEFKYNFEFIYIDNKSTDTTREKLLSLAKNDKSVKLIFNTRNFGHIRSPYYGIIQTSGDATIYLASDLQDPPELIPEFIRSWEDGFKLVSGVRKKTQSKNIYMNKLRSIYYKFLNYISDVEITPNSTGFGLYDKCIIDELRQINDPYPFLRGLVAYLGHQYKVVYFDQPNRKTGKSKNNFHTLFDIGLLGIVSHSKIPLRIFSLFGFIVSLLSIISGIVVLLLKLFFWDYFPMGIAPIMIIIFFLFGFLSLGLGILGEYIATILTYSQNRPIVIEEERINFDE